jgi:excisionase family DNA binding protein
MKKIQGTSTPAPSPRLLRVKDAAAYLSVTVSAIRHAAWSKTLPAIRIGKRMLFDVRDLDAFVDRMKVNA